MFFLGLIVGMLGGWVWLTAASPYARAHQEEPGTVQVRCIHCGRMYRTGYNQVRVDAKCSVCA